jgi:hypothetical protein
MVVDHHEAPRVDPPFRLSLVGLTERMQFSHSTLDLHARQAPLGQAFFGVEGSRKARAQVALDHMFVIHVLERQGSAARGRVEDADDG